jgi:hypothetical protein
LVGFLDDASARGGGRGGDFYHYPVRVGVVWIDFGS